MLGLPQQARVKSGGLNLTAFLFLLLTLPCSLLSVPVSLLARGGEFETCVEDFKEWLSSAETKRDKSRRHSSTKLSSIPLSITAGIARRELSHERPVVGHRFGNELLAPLRC